MKATVREEPSSGLVAIVTPLIDEIGALDRSEFAIAFVRADFVCAFNEALSTDAEKAVPGLAKLGSTKFTSNPYFAAAAEAAKP